MEAALGADFSAVRVHVGPQAERIGAIAFTVGTDLYFAPGRYQPETIQGQQLLGHELAHVVQQRAGRVRNPLGSGLTVVQDRALEAEADRLGQRAAAHRTTMQAKLRPPHAAQSSPRNPLQAKFNARPQLINKARLIQRMEEQPRYTYAFRQKHIDFDDKTKLLVRPASPQGETMHHKISQANLKRLTLVLAQAATSSEGSVVAATNKLLNTVYKYMKAVGIPSNSAFELLNNMPLNLAYGPTARWHHMGSLFDPSVDMSQPDPTGDVSHKEEKAERRPKLYRRLSSRSLKLSEIDILILGMPLGLVEIRDYVQTTKAADDLTQINDALAVAITKDEALFGNQKRFYDADQWQLVDDKYTRATTTDVFETYDETLGFVESPYVVGRNRQLKGFQTDWKLHRGGSLRADNEVKRLIDKCYAAISTLDGGVFTKESIEAHYKENLEDLNRFAIQLKHQVRPKQLKLYGPSKKAKPFNPEDSRVMHVDWEVGVLLGEIAFIVGD